MLWAIDVGNSQTVFGRWSGSEWRAQWRVRTSADITEDELAANLAGLCRESGLPFSADTGVVIGSVVPGMNYALEHLCRKWLKSEPLFLRTGAQVGIEVEYRPADSVGPDRIANAVGALAKWKPPIVVVDFGTATTFDAVSASGAYVGGAILPGPLMSLEALFQRTAKLPQVEFQYPERAIGQTTTEAIQSGVVRGYAGAIESLAAAFRQELGGRARIVATGGLGGRFATLCPSIEEYAPTLTLDGLRLAWERLGQGSKL